MFDYKKPPYKELVCKVMQEVFNAKKEPRVVDYEEAVANWLNKECGYSEKDSRRYTTRSVHSQVYKAVMALIEEDVLVYYKDKYIIPYSEENRLVAVELVIKKSVRFAKKEVFELGGKIVGISFDSQNEKELGDFTEIILEYIDEERIFEYFYINNTLMILLIEENHVIVDNLKRIVDETYTVFEESKKSKNDAFAKKKERQS